MRLDDVMHYPYIENNREILSLNLIILLLLDNIFHDLTDYFL